MTGSHPERLTDGLLREYAAQGRIIVFTLSNLFEATVDAWVEACLAEMERCIAEDRPLLILQDLARPGVLQTPYSREQGNRVTNAHPELGGRVAFVMEPGIISQRVGRYVRGQEHAFRARRVFYDRASALAWLNEPFPGAADNADD